MPEAVTIVTGFDDMTVVREPVQQSGGYLWIAKDLRPFREAQVGCNDDAGGLIKLTEHVEEQGTPGLAEGQIT